MYTYTSISCYLTMFTTEDVYWGSKSQWPSDCDENVGLTGCSGEVQQHQATNPTGRQGRQSDSWLSLILIRNFDISPSTLEKSWQERFLTWNIWNVFTVKTFASPAAKGCCVAEGRWHLRRIPHGHPPKLGDDDTHQWRLQVPLRPLDDIATGNWIRWQILT